MKGLLTPKEVRMQFGLSNRQIDHAVEYGQLQVAETVNSMRLFRPDDVQALIKRRDVQAGIQQGKARQFV